MGYIIIVGVFADTEGSFIIERVAEMAEAAVRHISSVADTDNEKGTVMWL